MLILTPAILQTVRRSLPQNQQTLSDELNEAQLRSVQGAGSRDYLIPSKPERDKIE